ncbi:MAG: pectinesterase family protein [Tepidisphaeraceae bacterium]|jgi:pectinesterase
MRLVRSAAFILAALSLIGAYGCASNQSTAVAPQPAVAPVPPPPPPPPAILQIVVAADGTGQFTTVQSAIDSINVKTPVEIHIKPGTYKESIVFPRALPPTRIWGDDAATTVLTFNRQANQLGPDGKKIGTFRTASVVVQANDFEADQITFENSTPRDISQALAISCVGDRQIYRHCRFLGWQDTIYTNGGPGPGPLTTAPSLPAATEPVPVVPPANRLYFEDSYIEGGVDFIFGNSTAVFNRCEIHSKRKGYLTAASTTRGVLYGYVFMNCKLTAEPDVKDGSVYLGRPWRGYANVTYLNCIMGPQISPAGWSIWKSAPERIFTVLYNEYNSTGPGASPSTRVKWSHQLTAAQAAAITIPAVLAGDDNWDPKPTP